MIVTLGISFAGAQGCLAVLLLTLAGCAGDPTDTEPAVEFGSYRLVYANGEPLPYDFAVERAGTCYEIQKGQLSLDPSEFFLIIEGARAFNDCDVWEGNRRIQFFQGTYAVADSGVALEARGDPVDLFAQMVADTAFVEILWGSDAPLFAGTLENYTFVFDPDQ